MTEWIKVTDRLPELDDDGYSETVVVYGHKTISFNFLKDNKWVTPMDITHWMPLPDLPEEK